VLNFGLRFAFSIFALLAMFHFRDFVYLPNDANSWKTGRRHKCKVDPPLAISAR
jgi:hypothetical protein